MSHANTKKPLESLQEALNYAPTTCTHIPWELEWMLGFKYWGG